MFSIQTIKPHTRVQIHTLRSHSPSNLNRDDTGRPKEARFGGVRRLRISSQSQKYAIRKGEIFDSFRKYAAEEYGAAAMVRTRLAPEELYKELIKRSVPGDAAREAVKEFASLMKKEETEKPEKAENTPADDTHPKTQLLALSRYEITAIANALKETDYNKKGWFAETIKEWKRERKNLLLCGDFSPEIQLFGRMITEREYFKDVDSPLQVAHSITTHEIVGERDYWIGADDLSRREEGEKEKSAAMIEVRRFGSGLFYQYACLDVYLLRNNLRGAFVTLDAERIKSLTRDLIVALVWAFAVQNPTGYQNSFASHAIADVLMIEVGGQFPHSAAGAFEKPVKPTLNSHGYLGTSVDALKEWDKVRRDKYGEEVFPEARSIGMTENGETMESLLKWLMERLDR